MKTITLETFYRLLGAEAEQVTVRLGSEALVRRVLLKFPDDPNCAELVSSLEQDRLPDAFRAAHTLKGIAANLGFEALRRAADVITEALHRQDADAARRYLPDLLENHRIIVRGISLLEF